MDAEIERIGRCFAQIENIKRQTIVNLFMKYSIYYISVALLYSVIFFCNCNIKFDLFYTLISICIYVISNVFYFCRRKSIINFEFFFCLAFFVASFLVYFITEIGEGFALFVFSSNQSSLVKGIALAMIGYHCYLCGLLSIKQINKHINDGIEYMPRMNICSAKIANCMCLLAFFLFLYMDGINLLGRYKGDSGGNLYLEGLSYWVITYSVAVYASFSSARFCGSKSIIYNLFCLNKLFLVNSVIIISLLLISGYRSQVMQVVIPVLICYNVFVKRLSSRSFLLILTGGLVLMIVVGMTRSGDQLEKEYSLISYLKDFNPANGALGFFVEEVDHNGITGGSNYMPQTLGIIPYLQSLVGAFVDFNSFASPSSRVYTSAFDTESGMGTHIVGDIYYSFGFIGVILIMFMLGKFCRWLSISRSKYAFLMYIVLTGNSVFAVRVELLYAVRMLAWSCFLLYLINMLSKSSSNYKLKIVKKC